jgi:DNA-3-methyladenine glycosylase
MRRIIQAKAWQTRNAVTLAQSLLGKYLVVRRPDARIEAHLITEVEAYEGESDLACHARAGRTRRTEVLYAAGGVWYVYLCYGIHEMLNLVVGPRDWPAAILIRGVDGISGPGRVTKILGIKRSLNGVKAKRPAGLWLEDHGVVIPPEQIQATPRIGVDYAGEWAKKPWRFVIRDISKVRPTTKPGTNVVLSQ